MTDLSALESLYFAALERAPESRAAFLDGACRDDPDLRVRVERLLAAHAGVGRFLEPPADAATAGHVPPAPADVTTAHTGTGEDVGNVIAGRYRLLERIGEGGMGSVFMAAQTEPVRRTVAVKLIRAGMDSKTILARFEVERQALALMDHPNIAKVLDAGATADGRPFFVMELVKGVPITRFCDERKLTPRERLELFVPVCRAIQHAHQKGVIHRDVKPSNVLVALYDGKPVPKVIDFGVAKATGQPLTEHTFYTGYGGLVGTPEYMSPEQATFNQLDVDTRSDVYSLGVLLYELLAGSPPFRASELKQAGLLEMLRVVREEEPQKPSTRLSSAEALPSLSASRGTEPKKLTGLLRNELDWIVMKALEKDRGRRYDTAVGFAADVERYLAGEPVHAVPPTAAYRLRKFVRRNKGRVVAAALVLLALIGGVIGTIYGLVRAENSLALARESLDKEEELRVLLWRESSEMLVQKLRAEKNEEDAKRQAAVAITERDRADKEAALAKAVEQFLVRQVLAAADPYLSRGQKVTIEDVLDRAAAAAGTTFAGRPDVEVGIREMLSRAFIRLGKYPAAKVQVTKALALRKELSGDEHPETLISQNDLAEVLYEEGKVADAEKLLRATLETGRRVHGERHPVVMATLNNLAAQLWRQRRPADAEPLTRRAYELQREVLGPDDENTLVSLMNLGVQILDQGRIAEAEPHMLKALDEYRRVHGDRHPGTISARNNVGSLRLNQGRLEEAERLYRETLVTAREVLSDQHPKTIQTMNNLAFVLTRRGKFEEVEGLYRRVLTAIKTHHAPGNPWLPIALDNLAVELERQGKLTDAWPYLDELYQLRQRSVGIRNPVTLAAQAALAHNLSRRKEWTQAEAHYQVLLAFQRDVLDKADGNTQLTRERLGLVYLVLDKPADAEPLFREWLTHSGKVDPPRWRDHYITSLLGQSLLAQKRYAEAEPHLLKGYRGLKVNRSLKIDEVNRQVEAALGRLVQLYDEWGKPAEAARWRAERAAHGPEVAPPPRPAAR